MADARQDIQLPEFAWLETEPAMSGATHRETEKSALRQLMPRLIAPLLFAVVLFGGWEYAIRAYKIPFYVLPDPLLILKTVGADWGLLAQSLLTTLKVTFQALGLAVVLGVSLAIIFNQFRWFEMAVFPWAVVLQVTPIVSIAPLIIIWADNVRLALLICAWIVAFFPILSNTMIGLNSIDQNLTNLFQLYRASRFDTLRYLRLPAAMPYFLSGLRISGGLSLIGAVVAEFVAGTGGQGSGLAYRILEASFELKIPRLFAALFLISATGLCIFALTSLLSWLLLRHWHESAMRKER